MSPRGVRKGTKRARRRGGLRSGSRKGQSNRRGRTKEQLYNEARRLGIEGRSKMTKRQLVGAVGRKRR